MTRQPKLWAPWRRRYILHPAMKGCVFCAEPKKKQKASSLILERGRHVFSILNLYPYNNGHVMIAPYRHLKSPALMSPEEFAEMFEMIKSLMGRLDGAIKPHGYNIGINVGRTGGAGYDKHVHLHIVPRWNGDTNFMPVVAGQKVISQSLFELKKALTGRPAGIRRRQQ